MTFVLRVGVHANNPTLLVLSQNRLLEERLAKIAGSVEWVKIAAGARTVEYVGANLIQIGGTGLTPPIAAQAKGIPLVYIAASEARAVGGIYVRKDSPVKTVADLAGKTVSLGVGSWLQALLATALDQAGLTWKDIVPLDLTEPESRKALLAGDIDAWVSGGGLRDGAEDIRAIANTGDLVSNPSVFFARRDFAEANPDVIAAVAGALQDTDLWIAQNPAEAAAILARVAGGPLSAAEWEAHIAQRPWGIRQIDDKFVTDQQKSADLFFRFGLLSRKVEIRDAVYRNPLNLHHAA
ncbi:aliphatic sulfonate ABC transporter substrate-binding protein [Tardiphaga sp.]|uniref:aliphatic sulfonate ABC transporter substrate-binding protein n=1 Tax=Tardiphaga sp. TaxID=1926292 RepID=UPI003529D6B0